MGCFGGGTTVVQAPQMSEEEKGLLATQQKMLEQEMAMQERMISLLPSNEQMLSLQQEQLDLQRSTNEYMRSLMEAEPTEYQKKLEEVGMLQADYAEKALRGELPLSAASEKRKSEELSQIKEALSRKGASETSTPYIQAMDEFETRWAAISDAERRGMLTDANQLMLSDIGLLSNMANADTATKLSLNPNYYGQGIGLLQVGQQGYGSLAGQYGSAASPYRNYSMGAYDANLQNAMIAAQGKSDLYGLLGQGIGALGMYAAFSDRKIKRDVIYI